MLETTRKQSCYFLLYKIDPVFPTLYSIKNTTWQLLNVGANIKMIKS
jgi:hypothetical protein